MAVGIGRIVGVAAVLALAGAALVGCDGKQVVSCGKTAITITGDVQDLEDSATNVGQLTDQARRQRTSDALKKLSDDAGKLHAGPQSAKAADDLSKAVQNAQQAMADGKHPDLGPVAAAAGELTKTCA
ncbi:hypothetical protein LN042_09190 [Kitasatospora sp. RB6PN24]|uniref:hypothetical protein n=1 Tax=Kitasatospora humi TaxID=2893891 RepID=UPI001E28F8FE|nr:hypothetical protein [Kitasatospora humi]MCC9307274.1 hypothetical protein [Kitasatospora humi]